MEKLLSPPELAELLKDVPEKTLADWRSRGVGPKFVRVGRFVRYRPADVEEWLEERAGLTTSRRSAQVGG